jgi:hypothetical protein
VSLSHRPQKPPAGPPARMCVVTQPLAFVRRSLAKASPAEILAEKNAFRLFATGSTAGLKEKKALKEQLLAIGDKAVKAAQAGDASASTAGAAPPLTYSHTPTPRCCGTSPPPGAAPPRRFSPTPPQPSRST